MARGTTAYSKAPRKFNNPLSKWLEKRKIEQKQLEEQAVRMVTNKIEDNALRLIDNLSNLDFIHTSLPSNVLTDRQRQYDKLMAEEKFDEARKIEYPHICSLDWTTRGLVQMLRNDRQNVNMDIRPIDEKLMALALMLQQFVAHGDVVAAKTTTAALQVGIQDIRCKLPIYQPELAAAFVEENTKYLDKWITLAGYAQRYDHTKSNQEIEEAAAQKARDLQAAKTQKIESRIDQEPEFAKDFFHILDHDSKTDRANWTASQAEVHAILVDAKLEDFNIKLHQLQSITLGNDVSSIQQQMDALRTYLNKLPIVSDPNLMNQYREAMEKFVEGIAESDARMEETLNMVDQISGALDQLNDSAGATLANEAAQMQAMKLFDKFGQNMSDKNGEAALDHARMKREHGWLSPEEREAQRLANEKRIAEEMAAQQRQRSTQTAKNTQAQHLTQSN